MTTKRFEKFKTFPISSFKRFIYYVYSVLPACMPAGQKRAPDLIIDGYETMWLLRIKLRQDRWKSSQCSLSTI